MSLAGIHVRTSHFAAEAHAGRQAALANSHQPRRDAAGTPRAVLYLRTATGANQADTERSIVAQQHACLQRANELGATVIHEFVDVASGMTADRPDLRKLLAELQACQGDPARAITLVIAYDHARIARNMHTYAQVVWNIEQAGARLVIASAPLVEYAALTGRPSEVHSYWLLSTEIWLHSRREGDDR